MARESEIIPARIVDKDDENVGSELVAGACSGTPRHPARERTTARDRVLLKAISSMSRDYSGAAEEFPAAGAEVSELGMTLEPEAEHDSGLQSRVP